MKMTDREKIRRYLRKEMKKIPSDKLLEELKSPFAFCYAQAKFDTLMDIDIGLELGAFLKKI